MLIRTRSLLLVFLLVALPSSTISCWNHQIAPPENEVKDPKLLANMVQARMEAFSTVRFKDVVLDYFGERNGQKERIKVRQVILIKKPNGLRIQTKLPGSDEILNLLVSNDQSFAVHQRDTNNYYKGKPTRENINKMTPVPLDLSGPDIVRVLLGGAPWDRFAQEKGPLQLEWNGKTGRYSLWVETRKKGKLLMEIRHTDFAVIEVRELDRQGKPLYSYTAESWKRHGNTALPTFMRFLWHGKNLDFSLDVGETQLGMELPDQLFTFPPPSGSQVIDVDS